MKRNCLFLLLVPLLLSPGCSRSPSRDLPPILLWEKDQNLIHPSDGTMNVWEGFAVKEGYFEANRNNSHFILWRRRAGRVPILVEYSLQGQKAGFTVNFRQKKTLLPALAFKGEKFYFELSRGFNLLKFAKNSKAILKIRAIHIGARREKPEPHLVAGQSFSLFHPPGQGRLEMSGRGKIEIIQEQTAGETLSAKNTKLRSGIFSRTISHDLEFSSSGLLTVKATKGSYNISAYSYVPTPAREADPKITFKGKPNIYIVLSDALPGFPSREHTATTQYVAADRRLRPRCRGL